MLNIDLLDESIIPSNSGFFDDRKPIVLPAEFLTQDQGIIKGHNTYKKNNGIYSSVYGQVDQIDKLISVNSIKSKYQPEIGDVVVGRVADVTYKRWTVNIGSKQHAILLLSSVNLPGGELRKKTHDDVIQMSGYLSENDLVVAEVQAVHHDGVASIHMRSLKYGKLPPGVLIKVPHGLCNRARVQFNYMEGSLVIISSNGWIWIGPKSSQNLDLSFTSAPKKYQDYNIVSRLKNLINMMAMKSIPIHDASLKVALSVSSTFEPHELLQSSVSKILVEKIISNL